MEKTILTIIAIFMAFGLGYCQNTENMTSQPTHVIGRRINEVGETTREFVSDFTYQEDGKLSRYEFPEFAISAGYIYAGDYITQENISHSGGHPIFHETNLFTYENGQVKTVSHLVDQMGINQYMVYSYYDNGQLARKDQKEEDDDDFHRHWVYEYENEGKTVIESYYTSWVSQGLLLRKRTINQHDDNYILLSSYTESYNESSELTLTTQTNYNYTEGMLDTKITQRLIDDEWINTTIVQYGYDDENRLVEQLDGTWNDDDGEWNFTKKITFEISEEGHTYIVSFYKKNGNDWVWDIFDNQTILFGSNLQAQQRALGYFVYEEMNEPGRINQFEFTLIDTPEPIYLDVEEAKESPAFATIHPNPTTGLVTISGEKLHLAEVVNTLGQHVLTVNGEGNELHIDMAALPVGVYFVNVTDEEGRKCVRKVVKE